MAIANFKYTAIVMMNIRLFLNHSFTPVEMNTAAASNSNESSTDTTLPYMEVLMTSRTTIYGHNIAS